MKAVDSGADWSLCNPGPDPLCVWLEPWAEEFIVAPGSTISMRSPARPPGAAPGELEWTPDHLVIWADAPIVEVLIDGALQQSGSAVIAAPEGLRRAMLETLFADQPSARLRGVASRKREWPLLAAAVAGAMLLGVVTFYLGYRLRLAHLARAYPMDGLIGLDALLVGAIAAVGAIAVVIVCWVFLGRKGTPNG